MVSPRQMNAIYVHAAHAVQTDHQVALLYQDVPHAQAKKRKHRVSEPLRIDESLSTPFGVSEVECG